MRPLPHLPSSLGCSGVAVALLAALIAGCGGDPQSAGWEYMPDMAHSVAYDSFAPNPVLRDGKTLQAPPPGTIPRGFLPLHYGPGPDEAERAGRELSNPIETTAQSKARGEALFQTFCQVCHGATGLGDGPVAAKFPPPPAYNSAGVRDLPTGRIFHVITFGSGRMPSYAAQISPEDRWRLVLHIQRLQGWKEEGP